MHIVLRTLLNSKQAEMRQRNRCPTFFTKFFVNFIDAQIIGAGTLGTLSKIGAVKFGLPSRGCESNQPQGYVTKIMLRTGHDSFIWLKHLQIAPLRREWGNRRRGPRLITEKTHYRVPGSNPGMDKIWN